MFGLAQYRDSQRASAVRSDAIGAGDCLIGEDRARDAARLGSAHVALSIQREQAIESNRPHANKDPVGLNPEISLEPGHRTSRFTLGLHRAALNVGCIRAQELQVLSS